jgi:hypothetical protein
VAGKKGRSGSGGVRPGAGRKRLKPEVPLEATTDFATRVLHRVGDKDWLTYADVSKVRSDEAAKTTHGNMASAAARIKSAEIREGPDLAPANAELII